MGLVAVALGASQGLPTFEFPFYADIAIIVGLAGVTRVVTRTALAHREPHVYISVWFFVAAVWWLLFSYVVGSLRCSVGGPRVGEPLRRGRGPVPLGHPGRARHRLLPHSQGDRLAAVQRSAGRGRVLVGCGNLRLGGSSQLHLRAGRRLARDHQRRLCHRRAGADHGSRPANLLLSIDWTVARQSTPVRLALAGTAFFALLAVQILGLAFRASSSAVQFTTWTEATFIITVVGAGSLWLMALLPTCAEGERWRSGSPFPVLVCWSARCGSVACWRASPGRRDPVRGTSSTSAKAS